MQCKIAYNAMRILSKYSLCKAMKVLRNTISNAMRFFSKHNFNWIRIHANIVCNSIKLFQSSLLFEQWKSIKKNLLCQNNPWKVVFNAERIFSKTFAICIKNLCKIVQCN